MQTEHVQFWPDITGVLITPNRESKQDVQLSAPFPYHSPATTPKTAGMISPGHIISFNSVGPVIVPTTERSQLIHVASGARNSASTGRL